VKDASPWFGSNISFIGWRSERIRCRAKTKKAQHPLDDHERDGPSHHDRQPASETLVLVSGVTLTWHPSGRRAPVT
jgi:hypothetical protein